MRISSFRGEVLSLFTITVGTLVGKPRPGALAKTPLHRVQRN